MSILKNKWYNFSQFSFFLLTAFGESNTIDRIWLIESDVKKIGKNIVIFLEIRTMLLNDIS